MNLKPRLSSFCLTLTILCLGAQQTLAHSESHSRRECRKLDVMTRNLFLGTDFAEIFAAQDTPTLLAEVAEAFAEVQASDVESRIEAIAREIKAAEPDLVSLQEVVLWQTGPFDPTQPSANTVAFDYLELLLDELNKRNKLRYELVAVLTNLVAEAPAAGPAGLFDVRFTDRIVILARADLKKRELDVENVVAQHFSTLLSVPTATLGLITVQRGYIAADVQRCGETFRFIAAHLEGFEELLGLQFPIFRFAQATELLQGPASTGLPLVLAGDFNADAENPSDPTYQLLLSGGFRDAWQATHHHKPGFTWPLFVESPFIFTPPTQRIDLVLTRGGIRAKETELTGERDVTQRRPMPSDHAGVLATLKLPR